MARRPFNIQSVWCESYRIATDLSQAGATQVPILARCQVHMDQLATSRQLQVGSHGLGDVRAGDVRTDDQIAWSHDRLPSG